MKTTYLLIVFVSITVLFFYFAANFSEPLNPTVSADSKGANRIASPVEQNMPSAADNNQKNIAPLNFRGPSGKPGMVGPQGPPPNY